MANKQKERCSTSYVIRETQIKTKIRYHQIVIRMAKIQNTYNTKCWWGCEARETFIHCWWECKIVQPFWKTILSSIFLTKLNMLLPHDPAIEGFGIYLKELKTYVHTKTYIQISIAALFIIAKTWKQPRWINKINGKSRQWNIF